MTLLGSRGPVTRAEASPRVTKPVIGPATGDHLHVMTFNIRYDHSNLTRPGDPDHWPGRAPLVTRLLQIEQPTILGVQEAEFDQMDAIRRGLSPDHQMLGFGNEGGSAGLYCSIFFDAIRLEPLAWDQYWLSDTPRQTASSTWGNELHRIVTWVRFRDTQTGRQFVHLNTHFDHVSDVARENSARMIRDQVRGLDVPAIVTGDFNAAAKHSAAFGILVTHGPLRDTWTTGRRRLSDAIGTFPAYGRTDPQGARIDWVLATPDVMVRAAALNAWTHGGRYPSDHIPVQALVRID